jgi:hypothetical protein
MSGSTWTWVGNTTAWTDASNWSLTGGDTGNANDYPAPGDTALLNSGIVQPLVITGTQLSDNTIDLSGSAVLDFANGSTLDDYSVVNGASGSGTIGVSGTFTDVGDITIAANATLVMALTSGSTLVSNGASGTPPTGDWGINDGLGGYFNGGTLYVLGGTIDNQEIHVNGGYTDITSTLLNNDELSVDGGMLEIDQQSTVSPSQLSFENADTAVASTIKFDAPSLFNGDDLGDIYNFITGDTLDIGVESIGTLVYNNVDTTNNLGTLIAEDGSGNVLFSAVLSQDKSDTYQQGSFTLNGSSGVAGSFLVTQGSGDTLISLSGTTSPGPLISAGGSVSYTAGGTPATLDAGLTVSDAESSNLDSATVALTSGFLAGDTLSATTTGTDITANYSAGTLTLSGTDTLSDYQTVLDSVTYSSSAGDPTNGGADDSRGIAWMVNDGTNTGTGNSSLSVSTPPTGPVVTAGGSASYNAGSSPATLDAGLTISDAESSNLDSATVTISSGYFAGDTLAATASEPDISVSYNSGTLTLTGTDTLSDYQTVLDSVTYSSSAGDPTDGGSDDSRSISWVVSDGTNTGTGGSSLSVSTPPTGPAVTAGGSASYNAGSSPATLDAGLTISDAEASTLDSATVAITSGFLAGDTLSVASADGISVNYNATTGTLTLSGAANLADYQTELDAVTYSSSAGDPTADGTDYSRTISWVVNDGTASSTTSTSSLSVTASVGIIGGPGSAPGDFTGVGLSDILYEDTANGASGYVAYPAGSNQGTWVGYTVNTAYSVAAIGDFTGGGTSEILYRDNANGAEGYVVPAANGSPASWVGLPDTSSAYTVVGSGDFTGNGQDSVLFEDLSTGDLGYFTLGNSSPNTWQSLGTPSLLYSVVGVGDFNGDGTSDIMFRDNATGQEGYYAMPQGGGQATWVGLGTSSTAYSVVGIGTFSASSVAQIMFRDNATGDFGYVTPANGSNVATWTDVGLSETAYTVVQVGDFTGNGLSDVLFRDNATGDVGYWAPSSGGSPATWTDLGTPSSAYSIMASPTWGAPTHLTV